MPVQLGDISVRPGDETLDAVTDELLRSGPDRVIISRDGIAAEPGVATFNNKRVDTIFVRYDGWSLGTPKEFEFAALRLWRRDWIAKIDVLTRTWVRMVRGDLVNERDTEDQITTDDLRSTTNLKNPVGSASA